MSSREDAPEPDTSTANTSQVTLAAPQDNNQENPACPACRHISTECSSSCRHCFCRLCLWDWSLSQAECPRCQRPTRHPYPQHVALYHEVQDRIYDYKRRRRGRCARRPRSSSGRFGHGGPRESGRARSARWPHDDRWRSPHARGSDSPRRRRRWQGRRAWDDPPGEGRAPRSEGHVPAFSRGSRSRRRFRRAWSHQERSRGHRSRRRWWSRVRERSYGWNGWQDGSSRRYQDTQRDSRDRSARQRRWRSWNADDRHTARPQHDIPSGRSERLQWEDWDSSRQQHGMRSRTRGRSHRRYQDIQRGPYDHSARQRRWRSWNADDRHQRDIPSGRRERLQWEDWDSSRQRHETRSRTRGRSHRRGQDTQAGSQEMVPLDDSTRQRRWRSWNADEGRAPRSQRDILGSSGRSRHRRRSRSRARRRDR